MYLSQCRKCGKISNACHLLTNSVYVSTVCPLSLVSMTQIPQTLLTNWRSRHAHTPSEQIWTLTHHVAVVDCARMTFTPIPAHAPGRAEILFGFARDMRLKQPLHPPSVPHGVLRARARAGHTRSLGRSKPELLCTYRPIGDSTVYVGPLDPLHNSTYHFLRELFGELYHVFADSFVHLGGDEVDPTCWSVSQSVMMVHEWPPCC